ncbi:hypothetical protein, partial [Plasmodium yoelii yoelii]
CSNLFGGYHILYDLNRNNIFDVTYS